MLSRLALMLLVAALAAGCDALGIESATDLAAKREADGRAIGGACRHAGRAIEDCYALNRKSDRAAVYAGWREMNDYMRENKLEPVAPVLVGDPVAAAKPAGRAEPEADTTDKSGDKPAAKAKKAS